MIKGKKVPRLRIRRIVSTKEETGETFLRQANPDDEPPPRRRFPTNNEDIFGLLQDIEADIFASTRNLPAEDSYDGAIKASGGLSALESLPLSPLMHPQLLAARRRYIEAKPRASKELTKFQNTLARNPYAKILASPVRACILTGARLPSSLLLPFTIQNHPRTRTPWLVPQGLEYLVVPGTTSETTPPLPPRSYLKAQSPPTPQERESPTSNAQEIASPPSPPSPLPIRSVRSFVPSPPSPTTLPSVHSMAYLTTQLSALDHIASMKPRSLHRILPFRWKTHFGTSLQSTVCRDDLADFVLSRLRKRLVEQLLALGEEDVPYLIAYSKVVEGGPSQLGAVLWAGVPREGHEGGGVAEPETCMTVRVPGTDRLVPLYNLRALVGTDGMQELDKRRGGFWRRREMVGVRARGAGLGLLAELWRLMVYFGGERKGLREWKVGQGNGTVLEACVGDGADVE